MWVFLYHLLMSRGLNNQLIEVRETKADMRLGHTGDTSDIWLWLEDNLTSLTRHPLDDPVVKDVCTQPTFPLLHSGSGLHCGLQALPAFLGSLQIFFSNCFKDLENSLLVSSSLGNSSWRIQSNTVTLFFYASNFTNKMSLIFPFIKCFSFIIQVDLLWSLRNSN